MNVQPVLTFATQLKKTEKQPEVVHEWVKPQVNDMMREWLATQFATDRNVVYFSNLLPNLPASQNEEENVWKEDKEEAIAAAKKTLAKTLKSNVHSLDEFCTKVMNALYE